MCWGSWARACWPRRACRRSPPLAAQAAGLIQGADGLEDVLESYLTRMDLWIEGYRQNAVLGKLPDGTTTMSVYYDVPPAAIKSQAKQMVLDLLSDQVTLARLQEVAGEEMSQLLLNPNLQSYYFSAIDALPLGLQPDHRPHGQPGGGYAGTASEPAALRCGGRRSHPAL